MNKQQIQDIQKDWEDGLSHGEIREKHHYLDPGVESAITVWNQGLTIDEIAERITHIEPFMTANQIKDIMQPPK